MGYLTGALGKVVPLPGGLGGVEGAMIGAFLARLRAAARTVREWDDSEITQSM